MTVFSRGSEEPEVLFSPHQPEEKKILLALQITRCAAIHQQTTSTTQITVC